VPEFLDHPATYYLGLIYIVYVLGLSAKIITENKEPQAAIGWIFALIFIPYAGVFLYLLSGVDWRKKKIVRYRPEEVFKRQLESTINQQDSFLSQIPPHIENDTVKAIRLNLKTSGGIITFKNRCDFYYRGDAAFGALFEDLRKAEKFIHMEYFIWHSDALGESLAAILLERAASGVQVRLIFDGVGCFMTMKRRYRRMLKEGGVDFRFFLDPMNPLSGRLLNYRNHRKIAVIDGRVGYCGGMNIAEEYISGGRRFETWRDTHFRLEGEAVQMLEGVFLSDWRNSGGAPGRLEEFFPDQDNEGYLPTQIICSGPDSHWMGIKKFLFHMISNANKEVLIQTPYFIPDQALLTAITTTAMSGVKVKFMMTGKVDKRMPFWAAQTYFEPLLEAGVEVYLYTAGFMHAKVYVADESTASAGTCNLDFRSLHLHYEVNAVFYDAAVVKSLRDQFEEDLAHCKRLTLDNLRHRNWFIRFRNSLFRIISPVL
jgi:cardiolipin synthase